MEGGSSWLCDAAGRQRLMEMGPRVRRLRAAVFALQLVALIACTPWLGWWAVLPLLPVAIGFTLTDRLLPRMDRPEVGYFAAWVLAQGMVAVGAAMTGGPHSPVLYWLAIPVGTLAGRFTARGVVLGVVVSVLFLLAATLGTDPAAVVDAPALVIFPAVTLCAVALLSSALMRSDVQHRSDSVVDSLTQMLNRKALGTRAVELAQQSAISGEPVGMVLGDLDDFKAVNDRHGHLIGDQVLRDVAYRLRKALRAYDLAYRVGGEEFLVVVPGATLPETVELAEKLRHAVAREPVGTVAVTMSFGVAATTAREAFNLDVLYAAADAALYEAKEAGRNCVRGDRPTLAVV
jgi:diguanylate cyclase (GGDEF)-like protein